MRALHWRPRPPGTESLILAHGWLTYQGPKQEHPYGSARSPISEIPPSLMPDPVNSVLASQFQVPLPRLVEAEVPKCVVVLRSMNSSGFSCRTELRESSF